MSKQATIASLVRTAAKSESDFVDTVESVFQEGDVDRIAEFFDRLNIPRSTGADSGLQDPLPNLQTEASMVVWDFPEEMQIAHGIQRFLDRHERKIKWHAGHPSIEGTENVLLVFRACMCTTTLRLARLRKLMAGKEELSPLEWSHARKLMNKSYLSFRNFLDLVANNWLEAMSNTVASAELQDKVGTFYELIDQQVAALETHRDELEEKRRELTVIPDGYPPVKPPVYFHGDLLGKGPWKQFWTRVNGRAHTFREAMG